MTTSTSTTTATATTKTVATLRNVSLSRYRIFLSTGMSSKVMIFVLSFLFFSTFQQNKIK